ncbi:hypothetical protein G6F42_023640 [Rhizopus arrhizus]|nr:hypothetical protein G6F42_023640 [Rhizopus arrhizus]
MAAEETRSCFWRTGRRVQAKKEQYTWQEEVNEGNVEGVDTPNTIGELVVALEDPTDRPHRWNEAEIGCQMKV